MPTIENPEAAKHLELIKTDLRQQAAAFIAQFPVLNSWTSQDGATTLNREKTLDLVQKIYTLDPQVGVPPQGRISQLQEIALIYGLNQSNPPYDHLPTALEAYRQNEEASLHENERLLTLPTQIDIFSLAIGTRINGVSNDLAYWINPNFHFKLRYPHSGNENSIKLNVTADETGAPIVVTRETRVNAARTGHEAVPDSETIYTVADLAQIGYSPEDKYVRSQFMDVQRDVVELVLLSDLRAQADWIKVGLLEHNIRF